MVRQAYIYAQCAVHVQDMYSVATQHAWTIWNVGIHSGRAIQYVWAAACMQCEAFYASLGSTDRGLTCLSK